MNHIVLSGCTVEPLAAYLKGLAVLRLVAQQKDPDAKGWWQHDSFIFESKLDLSDLLRFFLDEYIPTPVVAPWNGGSGFYDRDSKEGIDSIVGSNESRLADYRDTIREILRWPEMALAQKCRRSKNKLDEDIKESLLLACRSRLGERALEWIDAAVTIGVGKGPSYPPILGTGGNEGRLEYTNAFMRRIAKLLLAPNHAVSSGELLRHALIGTPSEGLSIEPVGQHDPGRAGGFDQGPGIEQKKFPTNPWAFILALEGSPVWASGVVRRQGISTRACFPAHSRSGLARLDTVRRRKANRRTLGQRFGHRSGTGLSGTAKYEPLLLKGAPK